MEGGLFVFIGTLLKAVGLIAGGGGVLLAPVLAFLPRFDQSLLRWEADGAECGTLGVPC